MLATRAGLFKRLSVLEEKQREAWVREWEPVRDNTGPYAIPEAEWDAMQDETPYSPELEAWECPAIDAFVPRLEASRALEQQWIQDLKPPRTGTPSDEPDPWNFDAPTHPLKPCMPAEVCETYRLFALLLEGCAPESPDPERLRLEAAKWRFQARWARGYAGLRAWNTWDWKPKV